MLLNQSWRRLPSLYVFPHSFSELGIYSFCIVYRPLTPSPSRLQSFHAYGGAQPALLRSFQSMQQAYTFRAEAYLRSAYLTLQSRHTFRR